MNNIYTFSIHKFFEPIETTSFNTSIVYPNLYRLCSHPKILFL